jgi:DNA invertase Pin-like site-specific DNA recombinase
MTHKVDFVCCESPAATKFTIHILAAVAEHERDAISAPKGALAAAKARGMKLGTISASPRPSSARSPRVPERCGPSSRRPFICRCKRRPPS